MQENTSRDAGDGSGDIFYGWYLWDVSGRLRGRDPDTWIQAFIDDLPPRLYSFYTGRTMGYEEDRQQWDRDVGAIANNRPLETSLSSAGVQTSQTTGGLEGRKDDSAKPRVDLLPFDAIETIAEILRYGADKYGPRNWEKGMEWHRPFGACLRHLWAWWRREPNDIDTGKSHLWHAGCCILFLIAYELRGTGKDNRP